MEREPSGFPFLEINNILTQLKCLQLVKKWFYHFFDKLERLQLELEAFLYIGQSRHRIK